MLRDILGLPVTSSILLIDPLEIFLFPYLMNGLSNLLINCVLFFASKSSGIIGS